LLNTDDNGDRKPDTCGVVMGFFILLHLNVMLHESSYVIS